MQGAARFLLFAKGRTIILQGVAILNDRVVNKRENTDIPAHSKTEVSIGKFFNHLL